MKQDKKLMLKMSLLFLMVFVVFGVIIVNDKLYFYYLPKIEKKLNKYIENNYKDEKYYFNIGKAKYKNGKCFDKNNIQGMVDYIIELHNNTELKTELSYNSLKASTHFTYKNAEKYV